MVDKTQDQPFGFQSEVQRRKFFMWLESWSVTVWI